MFARCAAIGLLVIACITGTGCGTPGLFQFRSDMAVSSPIGSIIEPPIPETFASTSFTIEFTTFIPANHLVAPSIHPQSYGSLVLAR